MLTKEERHRLRMMVSIFAHKVEALAEKTPDAKALIKQIERELEITFQRLPNRIL